MLLHIFDAANEGCKTTIITTDYNDVLVICIGLSSNFSCFKYQKHGTQNHIQFIWQGFHLQCSYISFFLSIFQLSLPPSFPS